MRLLILIGLLTLSVVACKKDNDDEEVVVDYRERDDQLIRDYLEKNDIEAQKDEESGLYYRIRNEGEGLKAEVKDTVVVRYIGKVISRDSDNNEAELAAKPFDFSPNAEPARRFLLKKDMIEGWKIGMPLIKKGGSIDLFIPSHLGYGNTSKLGIPANSVLFFDIDLEDVVIVPVQQ